MAARDAVALFVRDPACQEEEYLFIVAVEVVRRRPRMSTVSGCGSVENNLYSKIRIACNDIICEIGLDKYYITCVTNGADSSVTGSSETHVSHEVIVVHSLRGKSVEIGRSCQPQNKMGVQTRQHHQGKTNIEGGKRLHFSWNGHAAW